METLGLSDFALRGTHVRWKRHFEAAVHEESRFDSGCVLNFRVLVQKVAVYEAAARTGKKKSNHLTQFSRFSTEKLEKVKTNSPIDASSFHFQR
jgi:hypothetical protein